MRATFVDGGAPGRDDRRRGAVAARDEALEQRAAGARAGAADAERVVGALADPALVGSPRRAQLADHPPRAVGDEGVGVLAAQQRAPADVAGHGLAAGRDRLALHHRRPAYRQRPAGISRARPGGGGPDVLGEPRDERPGRLELHPHDVGTARLVQPRFERVPAVERELPAPQQGGARVVGRVAARRALQRRRRELQAGLRRGGDRALERLPAPPVVDRGPEALDLIGGRVVQAGGDEQAVERQLDVEAAGGAVADRDAELLLDRRARVKAGVVVRAEEMRLAEGRERPGDERPRGREQVVVVAGAVGPEPVAVVVVLELAQERERLGRPHDGYAKIAPTSRLKPGSRGEVRASSRVSSSATSNCGASGRERRKTSTSSAAVSTSHSSASPARS